MALDRLQKGLRGLGVEATPLELAEALWLARHIDPQTVVRPADGNGTIQQQPRKPTSQRDFLSPFDTNDDTRGLHSRADEIGEATVVGTVPVRVPAARALPAATRVASGLRSLRRRVPSVRETELDEEATARRVAESGRWHAVQRPVPMRWFDVAVVVDDHPSMVIWHQLVDELCEVLERLGAFRDVRRWRLQHTPRGELRMSPASDDRTSRDPDELVDPTGRRLTIVVSDAIGPAWDTGRMSAFMEKCGKHSPTVLLQPLPQRLWNRTALQPLPGKVRADRPGAANAHLRFDTTDPWVTSTPEVPVPVLEIEPSGLAAWARLVSSGGAGVDLMVSALATSPAGLSVPSSPRELVAHFRASASAEAFQLARNLAAVPLSLPVMRLVQAATVADPDSSQLAEVYLSGLFERAGPSGEEFEFAPGVRDVLLSTLRKSDVLRVLRAVTDVVTTRFDQERGFVAHLPALDGRGELARVSLEPFALVADQILRRVTRQPIRVERRVQTVEVDLVERCRRLLPFFQKRLPNPSDAEDALQDLVLTALNRLNSRPVPKNLDALLAGIAQTILTTRYAEQRHRADNVSPDGLWLAPVAADLPFDLTVLPDLPEDMEVLMGKRELWRTVQDAVVSLPDNLRRIMEAHMRLTMTHQRRVTSRELADELGSEPSRIARQLHRARRATADAVGALVLARSGGDRCADLHALLDTVLPEEQKNNARIITLTPKQATAVRKHAEGCTVCEQRVREARDYSRW
jgi:RNA polymerase sigma factor (sigma-70 family)